MTKTTLLVITALSTFGIFVTGVVVGAWTMEHCY